MAETPWKPRLTPFANLWKDSWEICLKFPLNTYFITIISRRRPKRKPHSVNNWIACRWDTDTRPCHDSGSTGSVPRRKALLRPCKGTGERGAVYQQYAVMQKSAGTTSGVQVTWMVQEYRLNFLSNEKCAACKMYTAPTFSKRRFVFDSECCGYSSENSFHTGDSFAHTNELRRNCILTNRSYMHNT